MRRRLRCRPRSLVGEARRRKQQYTRKTVRGRRTAVTQSLRLLRKIVRTTLIQKLLQRKRLRQQKRNHQQSQEREAEADHRGRRLPKKRNLAPSTTSTTSPTPRLNRRKLQTTLRTPTTALLVTIPS